MTANDAKKVTSRRREMRGRTREKRQHGRREREMAEGDRRVGERILREENVFWCAVGFAWSEEEGRSEEEPEHEEGIIQRGLGEANAEKDLTQIDKKGERRRRREGWTQNAAQKGKLWVKISLGGRVWVR
jgi:hypothetical protein